jgi:hypothetical protein
MHAYRQQTIIRRSPKRRGYALLLVIIFSMMFLTLTGLAWRRMASAIRVFSVRTSRLSQDRGSLQVLAHALQRLEHGVPPTNTYECYDTVQVPLGQALIARRSAAAESLKDYCYKVTFTRQDDQEGKRVYRVAVEAVSSPGTPTLDAFSTNGP